MIALRDRRIWELTQTEFIKIATRSVPRSRQSLRERIDRLIDHNRKLIKCQLLSEVLGAGAIPWDLFERTDPIRVAIQSHHDEVQKAIQDGWDVPWSSIKEYPDLRERCHHLPLKAQSNAVSLSDK